MFSLYSGLLSASCKKKTWNGCHEAPRKSGLNFYQAPWGMIPRESGCLTQAKANHVSFQCDWRVVDGRLVHWRVTPPPPPQGYPPQVLEEWRVFSRNTECLLVGFLPGPLDLESSPSTIRSPHHPKRSQSRLPQKQPKTPPCQCQVNG